MLKTIEFINNHKENWKELLSQPPYSLIIKEDEHYYLLKYNQIESDFNEKICRECRGLIIDKESLKPVALSFYKFFNVQEQYADDIDWESAEVQEKIDGSKILLFWDKYKEKWQICTSGNLNAYECNVGGWDKSFGDLFEEALLVNGFSLGDFTNYLNKDYCYTFELVSPESRIVVPYKETDLYFIGFRDAKMFEEYETALSIVSTFIKVPKSYSLHSLEDCLEATSKMGFDEEGFVVVDKNWNRVKIKSPAYLQAHYLANNNVHSNKEILNIILKNEQSEFLSYFPEWKPKFDEVEEKLNNFKYYARMAVNQIINRGLHDGKELADYISKNFPKYSDLCFKAFRALKKDDEIEKFIDDWFDSKFESKKLELLGL